MINPDTLIRDMAVSNRIKNLMAHFEVETAGQAVSLILSSPDAILRVPNFGRKSIHQLRVALGLDCPNGEKKSISNRAPRSASDAFDDLADIVEDAITARDFGAILGGLRRLIDRLEKVVPIEHGGRFGVRS